MYSKTGVVWAYAGSHTYRCFKQKYLQYMSVLSGVPDASCHYYCCCRELRARYFKRHLIGSIAVP
jgi:hypothetical protein